MLTLNGWSNWNAELATCSKATMYLVKKFWSDPRVGQMVFPPHHRWWLTAAPLSVPERQGGDIGSTTWWAWFKQRHCDGVRKWLVNARVSFYSNAAVSALQARCHLPWYKSVISVILILDLSIRACIPYEWEVTGSHLTKAKKFLFLGTAGLWCYKTQTTNTDSNSLSHE